MTASSNYLSYYPYNGRLNGNTGWCQKTSSITGTDYLQVDMGLTRSICAVATQGKKNGSYVTSYKLKLSTDGTYWTTYKENNVDKVCIIKTWLILQKGTRVASFPGLFKRKPSGNEVAT